MNLILILQHVIVFGLTMIPSLAGIIAAKYYYAEQRKMSIIFFVFGTFLCNWLIFLGMYAIQNKWHMIKLLSLFFPSLPI